MDENEHGYSNKKKKCTTSSSKAFSRPTIYPDRSDRRRRWSSRTPVAVTIQDLMQSSTNLYEANFSGFLYEIAHHGSYCA